MNEHFICSVVFEILNFYQVLTPHMTIADIYIISHIDMYFNIRSLDSTMMLWLDMAFASLLNRLIYLKYVPHIFFLSWKTNIPSE